MKKATHDGTCQICGSQQALPNGVLSQHGYTVERGYFEGVCMGSKHKPLELDRKFADEIAADLLIDAKQHDTKAKHIASGKMVPALAWNGTYREVPGGSWRSRRERVMVEFATATADQKARQVEEWRQHHINRAALARSTSKGITQNADRVNGKQKLQPRSTEGKREIVAGTVVHLYGKTGFDVTVLRVEYRVAQGCGPYMNGRSMPHIVFLRNGKEFATPLRLIRQSAIVA